MGRNEITKRVGEKQRRAADALVEECTSVTLDDRYVRRVVYSIADAVVAHVESDVSPIK